jgi:hypothetical protein
MDSLEASRPGGSRNAIESFRVPPFRHRLAHMGIYLYTGSIAGPQNHLLPLRFVAFQPPASRIPLLWKDRPTARLLDRADQIIFNFIALQRRG